MKKSCGCLLVGSAEIDVDAREKDRAYASKEETTEAQAEALATSSQDRLGT